MNLFILSLIQREIAMFMMDKHVSKILLEAVQMLCTSKRVLDPEDEVNDRIYKLAHKNHPVTIWCRASKENFEWTLQLVDCLHAEWQYRYRHTKVHKSYLVAMYLKEHIPSNFPMQGLTTFALAMPAEYKKEDPVEAYRSYYKSKRPIASWKNRLPPLWF